MEDKKLLFPLCVFPLEIQALIANLLMDPTFSHNYLCAALFFAVSIAIGNTRTLIFNGRWTNKAILFMGLLGNTGATKTPNIKAALAPIIKLDKYYNEKYKTQLREWKKTPLDSQGNKPKPKQLRMQDFTLEALLQMLSLQPHGLCVYVDELKGWLSSFNQYRGRGGDQEQWLSIHSGVPVVINRKTQDEIPFVSNPFVGVIGGVQTDLLPKLFGGDKMENGFFHRLLFVPESDDEGTILWKPDDLPSDADEKWDEFIRKILDKSGYFGDIEKTETETYVFSDDAINRICEWQNSIEKENIEEPDYKRAIFRKIQVYCLRFALIIHTMREVAGEIEESKTIDLKTATLSIVLADFFYETAQMTYEIIETDNRPTDFFRLLNALNKSFTSDQAEAVGERLGISRAKVYRLLKMDPGGLFVRRTKKGHYEKVE